MWIFLNFLSVVFAIALVVAVVLWRRACAKSNAAALALIEAQQEFAERVKNKQHFLAHISHELRTPMNGVLGMLEALKDTQLSEEQRRYVEIAHRSSNTLLTLLNDILDFSKVREGKLTLEQINFDLTEAIQEVLGLLGKLCEHKKIQLVFQEKNKIPRLVKGDPTRLKQILYNLIGNAVKFTEQGSIQLTVELIAATGAEIELRFEVIDTGIGIQPEKLDSIFEQFSQAEVSTARQYGGTGLGLSLCRQLTQLMGGTLQVTSEYGKGSTFAFTIKVQQADAENAMSVQDRLTQTSTDSILVTTENFAHTEFNCTVLVVEDNQVNQMVAVNRLKKLGCAVEIVADGQQAIEILKIKKFDLVLMDCQMPVLDGYEAAMQFRLFEQQNNLDAEKRTPIIAMTANAMPQDKQLCLDAGMDDYIAKPVKDAELHRVLKTYLAQS